MKGKDTKDRRTSVKDKEKLSSSDRKKSAEIDNMHNTKKTQKRSHIVFDDKNIVSDFEWDFDFVKDIDKTIKENVGRKKDDSKFPDEVIDQEEEDLVKKSDISEETTVSDNKLTTEMHEKVNDIGSYAVDFIDRKSSFDNAIMDDDVIEKYTKYPMDDYYASYYDTLSTGKRYRRFSWKAFIFSYYWCAFRLINCWMIFSMICAVGLLMYSLGGLTGEMFIDNKLLLNDIKVMNIKLFPFQKSVLGIFVAVSLLCLLFIGVTGDFIYAKYGVLRHKDRWLRKDKPYNSYSVWRVFGVIVACKLLFWSEVIVVSLPNKFVVPSLVWSMFGITAILFVYLIYDFFLADPKDLAAKIGTKEDYIYATSVKSEKYFKNQFRKYENEGKCNFNWYLPFFSLPYLVGKGMYRVFFLTSVIIGIVIFGRMLADVVTVKIGINYDTEVYIAIVVSAILYFVYLGCRFNVMYYKKIKKLNDRGKEIKKLPRIIIAAILWMFLLG